MEENQEKWKYHASVRGNSNMFQENDRKLLLKITRRQNYYLTTIGHMFVELPDWKKLQSTLRQGSQGGFARLLAAYDKRKGHLAFSGTESCTCFETDALPF